MLSTQTVGGVSSSDDIGIVSILMFWGMLETGVAIVAICLPSLYRLVRDVSPRARLQSLLVFRRLQESKDDDSSFLDGAEFQPGQSSLPRRFHGLGSILKSGMWRSETSHGEDSGPENDPKTMTVDGNAAMKLSLGFTGERGAEWPQMRNQSTIALSKRMHAVTTDAVLNAQQHPPRSQIWEMKEIQRTVEVV
ncbi:hypothetical protein BO86DRAFT_397091 [Aspergillus japonicus CBS 114.51]|uniref:Uncharacterized protein n=1 Tax=Aspergillus japonicus CBS 114.51 TaxID=1448312 RepID=A0A8T8X7T8_ASPJA|nr:hypothetical protein BO86DRAFT_397091 [Aspergillus japonicus CBS 114.51]RAH84227.1 hypothetical protein BO86DRAFT_397091 [Aspergillus japonicus CBS 114.51]